MRPFLAFSAFWIILFNRASADAWRKIRQEQKRAKEIAEKTSGDSTDIPGDAAYVLTLLQREGRLVDFLLENIEPYSDEQIGMAVRQIHAGCRKILDDNFGVQPILTESEGDKVKIESGFDPAAIRLTGQVSGEPPFTGTLQHRGWRITKADIPERQAEMAPDIIQPAEVEV